MKRIISILIIFLCLTACVNNDYKESYWCGYFEESFPENKLSHVLSYEEMWYCPDCTEVHTVLCPLCNERWDDDYYNDSDYHECDTNCCYCGDELIGVPHYLKYFCNECASLEYPEYFCHDCNVYSSGGKDLIANHCHKCFSYMSDIVSNIDFNKLKYDMSPNNFCLGTTDTVNACSSCGGYIYSWETVYEKDICINCVAALHPDRYCTDCRQCFLPQNIIDKHCLTCLFNIKSKGFN